MPLASRTRLPTDLPKVKILSVHASTARRTPTNAVTSPSASRSNGKRLEAEVEQQLWLIVAFRWCGGGDVQRPPLIFRRLHKICTE
jgi:hypothetical protein